MGQSAVEAETRGFAPGANPLRALLPPDTSASASAKAAAELIIETATAQFEEKRGPKAVEAMIQMSAVAGAQAQAQGGPQVMGPQPPPPGQAQGKGKAAGASSSTTTSGAASQQSGAAAGAAAAGAAKTSSASKAAKVSNGSSSVPPADAVPLPADGPCDAEPTPAATAASASPGAAAASANGDGAGAGAGTSGEPEEGQESPDALQATWGEVARALWHEWACVLAEALPFVPELFGWCAAGPVLSPPLLCRYASSCASPLAHRPPDSAGFPPVSLLFPRRERTEYLVRRLVAPGSGSRPVVLGVVTLVAAASVLAVAALLASLARVALEWASLGLKGTGQAALALWSAVAWSPQWWAAIPACAFFFFQSRFAALRIFWGAPFWWWLLGGGWWATVGSIVAIFNRAFIGSVPFWCAPVAVSFMPLSHAPAQGGRSPILPLATEICQSSLHFLRHCRLSLIGWPLLKASVRISSRLWITIPLACAVLAGWGLLFLLWLVAEARLAQEADGVLLDTTVPEDATGEVARVLGCRDYFSVLEIDATADKDAVRKAYRSKV